MEPPRHAPQPQDWAEALASAGDLSPAWPNSQSLYALRETLVRFENQGRDLLNKNPFESLLGLVLGSTALFYLAERQRNDRVNSIWDALEYVSTSVSVGYSRIFPETPLGKLLAAVLFTLGPTLAEHALDSPAASPPAQPATPLGTAAVLAKLDEILAELRAGNRPT